jgi:hypothetical protein
MPWADSDDGGRSVETRAAPHQDCVGPGTFFDREDFGCVVAGVAGDEVTGLNLLGCDLFHERIFPRLAPLVNPKPQSLGNL